MNIKNINALNKTAAIGVSFDVPKTSKAISLWVSFPMK